MQKPVLLLVCLWLLVLSPAAQNIALNKICGSSSSNGVQTCSKAFDGVVSEPSKWVSSGGTRESWIVLNLLDVYNITSVVVKNAGAAGENAQLNTKEYRIEASGSANGPWAEVKHVYNTSLQSIVSTGVSVQTKFLRLYIIQPNNGLDNYARIAEWEVYAGGTACASTLTLTGTLSSGNYQASGSITCTNINVPAGSDVNIIAPQITITGTATISQNCRLQGGTCTAGNEAPIACFPIEPSVLGMTGNTTAYGVKNGVASSWLITCSSGCGAHVWGDAYADDWAADGGDPATCNWAVYAPFEGTVLNAANCDAGGYGNNVTIRSASNPSYVFRVAHLSRMDVVPGQYVTRSTQLGTVGRTGSVDYCHAHVVLYKNIDDVQAANFQTYKCHHPGYNESSYYAAPFYFQNCTPAARNSPWGAAQPELVIPPVQAVENNGGFIMGPNPFVRYFEIAHAGGKTIKQVDIYNMNGEKIYGSGVIAVKRFQWNNPEKQQLPAGIYLVRISTPEGAVHTLKVIKQ